MLFSSSCPPSCPPHFSLPRPLPPPLHSPPPNPRTSNEYRTMATPVDLRKDESARRAWSREFKMASRRV